MRHSSDVYQGEIKGSDKAFKTFSTMYYGYRAAFVTLHTYLVKYDRNTIAKIIRAWAPPEDHNDTEAYIASVVHNSGVARDKVLTADSGTDYINIVAAMSAVENGVSADMDDVRAGFALQSKLEIRTSWSYEVPKVNEVKIDEQPTVSSQQPTAATVVEKTNSWSNILKNILSWFNQ
jgi:hypothetical protein